MKYILLCCAFFMACNTGNERGNKKMDYFESISGNDTKLAPAKPGEWRAHYSEDNQSFEDYCRQQPSNARQGVHRLYLLPIGTSNAHQQQLEADVQTYLSCFFQLTTEILPVVSETVIPVNAKRKVDSANTQLLTTYIIDSLLIQRKPADGYALMALTQRDLYPGENWNYVFGIASYKERVGVSSVYRYQCDRMDAASYRVCLRRILATAAHEIGHMFSMQHCLSASCVMNGSNNLQESDAQPLRLCSVCQQKLQWSIGYDNLARLKQLVGFLQSKGLNTDVDNLRNDLKLVM